MRVSRKHHLVCQASRSVVAVQTEGSGESFLLHLERVPRHIEIAYQTIHKATNVLEPLQSGPSGACLHGQGKVNFA